jgi:two-component system sensor histidine kinase AlgZ
LPDLCLPRSVLLLVLASAVLAFILTLARRAPGTDLAFWTDLAATGWLLLWIALGNAALWCALRRSRLPARGATAETLVALGVLAGVTALVSWGAATLGLHGLAGSGLPGIWDGGSSDNAEVLAPSAFVLRNVLLALLAGGLLLRYLYVANQWRLQVEAESRARVAALQARIRPHFLFNSLNTIAALADTDSPRAASAVEDLADLFRASLAAERMVATVATELDVAKAYVRLEQERLGSRLQVNWDLTALDTTVPMPPLMLQPLLENAVYHGIERLSEGGCITVAGGSDGKLAWIEVVNPLRGSSIDVLNVDAGTAPAPMPSHSPSHAPSHSPLHAGHHEALANIRERLTLLYGGRGSLQTTASTAGFTARLCWPFTGNS